MKNIFVLLFSCLLLNTNGQVKMSGSPATVTNAALTIVVQKVSQASRSVTVQGILTKVSGTIAGKMTIQGSINGVNYVNVDSLTLTDIATNAKVTTFSDDPYQYYKISIVGSGTMVATLNGYILTNGILGNATNIPLKSVFAQQLDTVTNTGTKTMTAKISGHYRTVSISATATFTTGTLGGTMTLQGSLDGVNYITVPTAFIETPSSQAPYTTTGAATFTVPNYSAPTKIFTVIGSPYSYFRISYAGTGTMVATIKGSLFVTN